MSRREHDPIEAMPHRDPTTVEWALPDEGLAARLQVDSEAMERLPPEAREKLTQALGSFALAAERIVGDGVGLREGGYSQEAALDFLLLSLRHMDAFFATISTTADNLAMGYLEDSDVAYSRHPLEQADSDGNV